MVKISPKRDILSLERDIAQEVDDAFLKLGSRLISIQPTVQYALMVFRKEMAAEELVGQREVVEYEGVRVNLIWV